MRNSLVILGCLAGGILAGIGLPMAGSLVGPEVMTYVLCALLFLVGIETGANPELWRVVREQNARMLLVPLSAVVGTLLGVATFSSLLPGIGLKESLAVGSGFGYYSLSSVLIGQLSGQTLGVLALLSNMMREMATLLTAPLLARHFGRLAPIASGGATSMDTTLPVITRCVGPEYAVLSVVNGTVLTVLAPVLIAAILGW